MEQSICMICGGQKLVHFGFNSNKIPVYHCESCFLYFLKQDGISNAQLKNRYQKGDFWDDTDYDLKQMLNSNFTDERGRHFRLNWNSMFEYSKNYLSKTKKILEIGVGTGVHMIMFDQHEYDITGIEPDTRNTLLINAKLEHGHCINGFVEEQKFENQFDIIWLYHVVEHITDLQNLFESCNRFLRKNGLLVIAVPDCDNPMSLQDSIENPDHIWHFSKKSLIELSSKMNYKIEKLDSLSTIKNLNKQRIYSRFAKYGLSSINKKIWPYWPLKITKHNDGYEIRLILRKINEHYVV